jgi:hypothetical protein
VLGTRALGFEPWPWLRSLESPRPTHTRAAYLAQDIAYSLTIRWKRDGVCALLSGKLIGCTVLHTLSNYLSNRERAAIIRAYPAVTATDRVDDRNCKTTGPTASIRSPMCCPESWVQQKKYDTGLVRRRHATVVGSWTGVLKLFQPLPSK